MVVKAIFRVVVTILTVSAITACEISADSKETKNDEPVGGLEILDQELQGQVGSFSGRFLYGHLIEKENSEGKLIDEVHLFAEEIEPCNPTEWARVKSPTIVAHLYKGLNKSYIGRSSSLNVVGNGATKGTLLPSEVHLLIGKVEDGVLLGGLAINQDVAGTQVNLNGYFGVVDCRGL